MALSERAKTMLLNALGAPEVVAEIEASFDEETLFIKRDGSQGPTANIDWEGYNLSNINELSVDNLVLNELVEHNRAGFDSWTFGPTLGSYLLQNSVSGSNADFAVRPLDADGSDFVSLTVVGVSSGANSESVRLRYNSTGTVELASVASGSGTVRPLHLYTGGNTTQLVLNIDNTVSLRNTTLAPNGTSTMEYRNSVSGSAFFNFFGTPGTGANPIIMRLHGLGTSGSSTDREMLNMQWDASNTTYRISTNTAGAGTVRPLSIYTGSNTNQLRLETDGSVQLGAASATPVHRLNTATETPAAGALTLTNGPGAASGDPSIFIKINVNGTEYVIPAWAF